jgi:hypothetical protein
MYICASCTLSVLEVLLVMLCKQYETPVQLDP